MKAIVLCYHRVAPSNAQGRRLNIHPERLKKHLRFFDRRDYRFLLGREMTVPWPSRAVCFTFDDAYESALQDARPLFDEISKKATFYAVTDYVGARSAWENGHARPLASWEALKAAYDSGHEIGNHTTTHARLANLELADQLTEISRASAELLNRGFGPHSFCYPYGSLNDSARDAVAKCGYSVGMALGKRPALASDPQLALPRIVVSYSDAVPKLLYKLYIRPLLGSRARQQD